MKFSTIGVVILFGVALFFSLFHLTESPSVWYDEGIYIQLATNVADGYGMTFQFAPGHSESQSKFTVGYPFIYPLAATFEIFGNSILVARSFMVAGILVLLAVAFIFVRSQFGAKMAILTLALLVAFPPLYGNGKSVLGEVPALLYLLLGLIMIARLVRSDIKRIPRLLLAGLLIGLCATTKPLFLLTVPAALVGAFVAWWRGTFSLRDIAWCALGVAMPLVVWIFVQFGIFADSSLLDLLTFYANPYHSESLWRVLDTNLRGFVTEAGPLYLLLLTMVWSAALFIRRGVQRIAIVEIIAFVFVVLTVLAYLRIVGWHRYLFPAQIIALLYFVPALSTCVSWAVERIKFRSHVQTLVVPLVVVLLFVWGAYGVLFNSWVAEFYQSDKTAFWTHYFSDVSPERSFFFYNTPEVAIFLNHRNFYQYLTPAEGAYGAEWLTVVRKGGVDEVIIRTDTFQNEAKLLTPHYTVKQEAYKYTILVRRLLASSP